MLENEYYTIIAKEDDNTFKVAFNPKSQIFRGHFPDRPVCPGVCSIEMILECCEKVVNRKMRLTDVKKCRFTHVATPLSTPQVSVGINISPTSEGCEIRARIYHEDTVFADFTGTGVWR
jgi:3-hydroxyacyl-[acyl-carrier-protein] dehydratase